MAQSEVAQRLRRFLLGVVAVIFIVTVFELILLEHTEEMLQWIPFVASGVGLFSVAGVWYLPSRRSLKILRWTMSAIAITSFVGVYLHFSGNLAFALEINPSYSVSEAIWPAMKGSYPLLAPGILFLAGILALAATYRHPLLEK